MSRPQSTAVCPICSIEFPCSPSRLIRHGVVYCSATCQSAGFAKPLYERFWDHVDKNGPTLKLGLGACWIWTSGTDSHGYGQISVRIANSKHRPEKAPRVSWMLHYGPIPQGLHACHRCDNPLCIRPHHLFLGTSADNMADMWKKGRGVALPRFGTDNHLAKLTPEVAEQIISEYAAGGVTQQTLAQRYDVDNTTISNVILRKHWASRLPS